MSQMNGIQQEEMQLGGNCPSRPCITWRWGFKFLRGSAISEGGTAELDSYINVFWHGIRTRARKSLVLHAPEDDKWVGSICGQQQYHLSLGCMVHQGVRIRFPLQGRLRVLSVSPHEHPWFSYLKNIQLVICPLRHWCCSWSHANFLQGLYVGAMR